MDPRSDYYGEVLTDDLPESHEASIVYWTPVNPPKRADLSSTERLIEAGWRALDETELPKIFASATTARVAKEAGVTTGSFFHHFDNGEAFARAMATALAESLAATDLEEVTETSTAEAGSPAVDLSAMIRTNMNTVWKEFTSDPVRVARFRIQMRLWSHNHVRLDQKDYQTIGDAMRNGYGRSQDRARSLWEVALEAAGLEVVEPFSMEDALVAASALFEGLSIRVAIDPESVSDELFADSLVALVKGVTRPAGRQIIAESDGHQITDRDEGKSPQARSGAQRRYETRRRIVASCTGMFSNGWEAVSATDIATRAGVSTQTITNLFGSVRAVAATTFTPHAQRLYQNALGRSNEDSVKGLSEALIDLAVRARLDPEVARALLAERVHSAVNRGGSLGDMDIRLEVPISGALSLWLTRMGIRGDANFAASAMLANFVLTSAITIEDSAQHIAELAMRLLPQEATKGRGAVGY